MSVARNIWRPTDVAHIVPAPAVDRDMAELLIKTCPAGLFSLTP